MKATRSGPRRSQHTMRNSDIEIPHGWQTRRRNRILCRAAATVWCAAPNGYCDEHGAGILYAVRVQRSDGAARRVSNLERRVLTAARRDVYGARRRGHPGLRPHLALHDRSDSPAHGLTAVRIHGDHHSGHRLSRRRLHWVGRWRRDNASPLRNGSWLDAITRDHYAVAIAVDDSCMEQAVALAGRVPARIEPRRRG